MPRLKPLSRQTTGSTAMDRWLLNVGAVLGTLCLVLAGLSLMLGLKPLIFSSGSMGPAIPTGSLALAAPAAAADVSPGEVVSVVGSGGTRVTHRVVSADPAVGLVLKGDANAVADLQPYTGATVDRVLFSLPGLGYVASWLASPWILLLGGLLCAYLIYVAFFRSSSGGARMGRSRGDAATGSEAGKSGTRRGTWLGIGSMAAVIAVVVPLGAAAKVEPTQAAWTANAAAGSAVGVLSLPAIPGKLGCITTSVLLINSAELSWNHPTMPAGARYVIRIVGAENTAYVDTGLNPTTKLSGGLSLLASLFTKADTLEVHVFSVLTQGNAPAELNGSNILWMSVEKSAPSTKVKFTPGLVAAAYACAA